MNHMTKLVKTLRVGFPLLLLWLAAPAIVYGQAVLYGASSGCGGNISPSCGSSAVGAPSLYRIDPTTLAGTIIGPIGIGVGAMAFNPATGILYGVTAPGFLPPSGTTRQLIRIDMATGQGAIIGPLGATGFKFGIADIAFSP